jgi:transcriptional antiterminator RfaH
MIKQTIVHKQWYVLYVKPRHEKHVFTIVRGRGYEGLLPLYARWTRSRTSELPLFPGYVFCRFDPADRLPVLSVPGVFSIVGFAGMPIPVPEHEIEALQRVILHGLPRQPWPTLTTGAPVTISRGPMQGIRGIVMKCKNITRVVIAVALLQRSIAVEVDREWLDEEPVPAQAGG